MSEIKQDCTTCLHNQVCRYVGAFQQLSQLGSLAFNCQQYLVLKSAENTDKDDFYKNMSKEEFLKLMAQKEKAAKIGPCEACGKKDYLYTCNRCGRKFCLSCVEAEENISLDGSYTETYLCEKCRGNKL